MIEIQQFAASQSPILTPLMGGISDLVMQKREKDAAAAKEAEYKEALGAYMKSKNPDDLFNLYSVAPERFESLKTGLDAVDEQQRKNQLKQNMDIIAPLASGNQDLAIENLEMMSTAYANSGDDQQSKIYKGFADQIRNGNSDAVQALFSIQAGVSKEGQDALVALRDFQQEQRAGQVHEADLLRWANDLNLTGDEKKNAMEVASKFDQQTAKMILEYSGTKKDGVVDPEKLADFTTTLRKEYTRDAAGFREANQNKSKMDISLDSNTSQGDIAAITTFMKMLDEGSVVREGEFRIASQTGGAIDMLKNIIGGWKSGQRLTPDQRDDFKSLTDSFYKIAEEKGAEIDTRMENVLDYHNIPKDQVMFVSEEVTPDAGAVVTTESGLTYTPVAADELSQAQAFARSRNPNSTGRIEEMTMEELQAAYPGTMGAFTPQTAIGTETVEVDY